MIYNFIKVKSIIRTSNDFWSENKTPFLMLSLLTMNLKCSVLWMQPHQALAGLDPTSLYFSGIPLFFRGSHFYKVIYADISNQLAETAWTEVVHPMIPFCLVNHEKNNVSYNYDNIHIACSQASSRCASPYSKIPSSYFCLQTEDKILNTNLYTISVVSVNILGFY